MSGAIKLKVRTAGADSVARRFAAARARLPWDVRDAEISLGRAAEVVFAAYAPVRSGRLIRGISSSFDGGGVTVRADARNPMSGYDYVGVTRFGHGVIRPKDRQFGAYVLATGKRRGYGRRAMLRFTVGNKVVYTPEVAAWRPASDWATDALPEVYAEADVVAARLGATIESRF